MSLRKIEASAIIPLAEYGPQRAERRTQHCLLIGLSLSRIRHEAEPLDAAEMLSLDRHLARRGDRRRHFTLIT